MLPKAWLLTPRVFFNILPNSSKQKFLCLMIVLNMQFTHLLYLDNGIYAEFALMCV